ncbi:TerB family tellurite resistance protein [Fulvivirga lutea]|uniref:TerB family tellurite resistance protein n=1 Tax=Fulvivirga lutea TaxID=2810512 RepID=A0A975A1D0_9BACT|nr:TerB family tellurite resistance protein [Fulvivirga lutea]QSE98110.1 TerB family tellurite resistance protein [Fulvivirga lutea]
MNPSKSGWLSQFIDFKLANFSKSSEYKKMHKGKHPDQSFYGLIQPTGIMYGYPVGLFGIENEPHWTDYEKTKVLLADSLINVAELYSNKAAETEEQFLQLIENTLTSITEFYRGVYPEIAVSSKTWLGKKKTAYELAEQAIEKRVSLTGTKASNFWSSFFSRSQLFLDVYIFGQWTHTNPDNILLEFFKGEKEELSFTSVKVIAAAAHANAQIEDEERSLFEHFLTTTNLPAEKRRVAQEYFEHGMGIQEIPIQESDPWLIRKFFLELSALTIWSDKKVEDAEREFLESFSESLGFNSDEFEVSLIAVEGFLLQNWAQLDQLQGKINYKAVSDEYIDLLVKMSTAHLSKIENMVAEDYTLLAAIKKGSSNELSEEDKKLIKSKFLNILQSIPNFRVVMLPDEFLSYDNLLRVIPKETITRVLSQD